MAGTVFNSHVTDRCDQKFILDQDYKQWEINFEINFEIEIFCNIEKKVFIFTFEFSFTSASTVTLSI